MREPTAVMEMTDAEKLEKQRKEISALKSRLRRALDNAELWRVRWERDKRR